MILTCGNIISRCRVVDEDRIHFVFLCLIEIEENFDEFGFDIWIRRNLAIGEEEHSDIEILIDELIIQNRFHIVIFEINVEKIKFINVRDHIFRQLIQ